MQINRITVNNNFITTNTIFGSDKMKRLIIITLAVLSVNFAVNKAIAKAETQETLSANSIYIIKEYNGKVACFEKETDSPFIVTDIKVIDLPPLDRKMLSSGVEVNGSREMSRALEDYKG